MPNLNAWLEEISARPANRNSRTVVLEIVRASQERAFKAKDQSLLASCEDVGRALGVNQQNTSQILVACIKEGVLKRVGKGCSKHPFRYYVPEGEK